MAIGRRPVRPSASWISTRALRLMSGNSGMRLASGKELSSVTFTSSFSAAHSVVLGGKRLFSGGRAVAGLSSSYVVDSVQDRMNLRIRDSPDLWVVRSSVEPSLRVDPRVDLRPARKRPRVAAAECAGVGLGLQVLAVYVPVPDPDDDAAEGEDHREHEREEHAPPGRARVGNDVGARLSWARRRSEETRGVPRRRLLEPHGGPRRQR